jgi:hypothetical protein
MPLSAAYKYAYTAMASLDAIAWEKPVIAENTNI